MNHNLTPKVFKRDTKLFAELLEIHRKNPNESQFKSEPNANTD